MLYQTTPNYPLVPHLVPHLVPKSIFLSPAIRHFWNLPCPTCPACPQTTFAINHFRKNACPTCPACPHSTIPHPPFSLLSTSYAGEKKSKVMVDSPSSTYPPKQPPLNRSASPSQLRPLAQPVKTHPSKLAPPPTSLHGNRESPYICARVGPSRALPSPHTCQLVVIPRHVN